MEKLDECPHCGCDDDRWHYDRQQCHRCAPLSGAEIVDIGNHSPEVRALTNAISAKAHQRDKHFLHAHELAADVRWLSAVARDLVTVKRGRLT